jgi:glycosyltransferase involved in cell wall biosynthesis
MLLARQLNFGGSERQVCEMAKALDPARFDVHVGAFYSGGARAQEVVAHGIPVVEVPVRSFKSPRNVLGAAMGLRRYIREHGIRIVHGFDPPTCAFLGFMAPLLRRAIVLTSQRNYRNVRTPMFRRLLRLSDRMGDGIVVNCEAMRQHLIRDEGLTHGRIYLCYNGLDANRFRRETAVADSRVPDGALVIGTVCLFRPEKDLGTLVRAFAAIHDSHPNLFLLMVGDGNERPGLERLVRELGIESRCLLAPAAAKVVPWLSRLDVFVLPSRFEACSNSLMEAMSCGCACVASRIGGSPELLDDGRAGLLFEAGDVAGLAAQLRRLVADPALRRELGQVAARRMRSDFSLQIAATRLGAIYDTVLRAGARRHLLARIPGA